MVFKQCTIGNVHATTSVTADFEDARRNVVVVLVKPGGLQTLAPFLSNEHGERSGGSTHKKRTAETSAEF